MPRYSAAEAATAAFRTKTTTRLVCRPEAPQAVQEAFQRIVGSVDPTHFAASDAPLVERYAEAIVMADLAAEALAKNGPVTPEGKASAWITVQEKAHRSCIALAQKLRLAPHSRISKDRAGNTTLPTTGALAALRYLETKDE